MRLRGTEFRPVFQASGMGNFFNNGYWYGKLLAPLGFTFYGMTVVTKTTTLLARAGNMPLEEDGYTPKEWMPKCIYVDFVKKLTLNAVGLSSPGLEFLINAGRWQKFNEPYFISVMSLAKTPGERLAELQEIFKILYHFWKSEYCRSEYGVQINLSCPNGGVDPNDLIDEAIPVLDCAAVNLPNTTPVVLKFGPEVHPSSMYRIANHPRCDGICVFNTLPFGKQPTWAKETPPVDWKKLFGTDDPKQSPIAKHFPEFAGGLSGAPLKPFLLEWLWRVRACGIEIPIIGGGGLLCADDALQAFDAGATAISPGSISMLRPLNLRGMTAGALEYSRK